ncbi:voltage-dependent anion-selective channel protein 1-like [Chionomys nivalis]|uniref:voltage-dependent anion-selective channel protein 1-like n=1 Tax=Chionomys nivalis TaxID=269649 RepID=UPI0025921FF8|nr:voltage-dependent anion-selective channel protein 1-like [Chionomys nivalis]
MAGPPTYADLGKSARDVFTKGYGFGLIKLDLKTKSENGLEFTSSGSANTETTKVNGSLETKYRWTEYGLTFTEKWKNSFYFIHSFLLHCSHCQENRICLRIQINPQNKADFQGTSPEQAFADFLFASTILHLVVMNFVG